MEAIPSRRAWLSLQERRSAVDKPITVGTVRKLCLSVVLPNARISGSTSTFLRRSPQYL